MQRVLQLPLFVLFMGLGSIAMYVPALTAGAVRDYETARPFLYGGTLFLIFAICVALATGNWRPKDRTRSQMLSLLGTFLVLPAMLALPFLEAVPDTSFINVYVEMVSSLTTTGATLFDPDRLPMSIHIWRAIVAWLGGLLMWITAFAVLAPLTLGGFEVTSDQEVGSGSGTVVAGQAADPVARIVRYTLRLAPVYFALTAILWILLILCGEPPAVALIHSLSTISTSGITAGGTIGDTGGGFLAELAIFIFLFYAVTRRTFYRGLFGVSFGALRRDKELRLAVFLVLAVPSFLFVRHWLAATEVNEGFAGGAFQALWGGMFMVLSFLTTTGFESSSWAEARNWSGLGTPGLMLAGMAVFGGGVATTAGGVKLLRVYALYKHGLREMEKLAHPSSVGGAGMLGRRIRREGAEIAWVFFMLFALSIGLVMAALALTGIAFEESTILAVAALSTTGPVASIASASPVSYGDLPDSAKLILACAMVLGRLETLAIIALLNPGYWRG